MSLAKKSRAVVWGAVVWPVTLTCADINQGPAKPAAMDGPIRLRCKESRELGLDKKYRISGLGLVLKTRPTPVLVGEVMVFNATKGVGAFSLTKRKLVWKRPRAKFLGRCGDEREILVQKKSSLLCLQGDTGKLLWRVKAPFLPIKSVLANSSRVFISSTGFRIAALKAENGSVEWSQQKIDPASKEKIDIRGGACWQDKCWFQEQSPLGSCGPNLVLGTKNGVLKAFSATKGIEVWQKIFRTPETEANVNVYAYQANGPWIEDGGVGFLGMVDKVVSFDCLTGSEKGELVVDGPVNAFIRYKDQIVGYAGYRHLFTFNEKTWPKAEWNYSTNLGECNNEDYQCYFIAGDIIWRAPKNPIGHWTFRGISLIDPSLHYIQVVGKLVIPRGRALGTVDSTDPIWKKSKKVPFLYWNKQFVHADGQTIRFFRDRTNQTQGEQGVE